MILCVIDLNSWELHSENIMGNSNYICIIIYFVLVTFTTFWVIKNSFHIHYDLAGVGPLPG